MVAQDSFDIDYQATVNCIEAGWETFRSCESQKVSTFLVKPGFP